MKKNTAYIEYVYGHGDDVMLKRYLVMLLLFCSASHLHIEHEEPYEGHAGAIIYLHSYGIPAGTRARHALHMLLPYEHTQ